MSTLATVKTLTSYKAFANELLFAGLRAAPGLERTAEFDLIRLVLDHALVVDLIFQAHLKGVAHAFTATRSSELPALSGLAERSRELDRWYVDYAENASEEGLTRRAEVRFTDGKTVSMSPAEMIFHVVNHGTYHRGNVGVLLHKNGIVPDRDGVPEFLARSPDPR
jgi:uncharacterized damage-inducible protein DinB